MHQLTTVANAVTMTSLEIAEITGKAHKNVLADIRKMLGELEIQPAKFSARYKDAKGESRESFNLPKRETLILVSGYDTVLRAKVVDRVAELESRIPAAQSPAQVLVAMAQQFLVYEQEQKRQSAEMARIQETVAVIEARTQPENKHFTVMGYANLIGQKIDIGTASRLGRQCANLSRESGLPIGDVSDPRFGKVHSYHESVLQTVMATGS